MEFSIGKFVAIYDSDDVQSAEGKGIGKCHTNFIYTKIGLYYKFYFTHNNIF